MLKKILQYILLIFKSWFVGSIQAPVKPKSTTRTDNTQRLRDIDILARTIWGEARGEGYRGMQAVANVIINRYKQAQQSPAKARQFGKTIAEICLKPYQFSVWNRNDPNYEKVKNVTEEDPQFITAKYIAELAVDSKLPDITNGADHYHTASIAPSWSRGRTAVASIGSHKFFRLVS